jgi:Carbohydrate-binding module 48 (Isoamylase N-terminal domain)
VSDRMPAPDPLASLIAELRAPVSVDSASKRRLMQLVREAPPPTSNVGTPARLTPSRSRALATIRRMRGGSPRSASASTLATAAGVALVLAVGTQNRADTGMSPSRRAVVIGDSVASVASAIRDTLRIVQFMLTAPAASRVALAGDFNGWDTRAIPMARDSRDGRWAVTLALAPGRHNYAYVVDDTQWVRDPMGTPAEPNELTPPRSVLIVNR